MKNLSEMLLWIQADIIEREPDHAGDTDTNHPELPYGWFLAAMGATSPGPVIEIGTDGGLGTAALAYASKYPVHSFDIRPDRVDHSRDRLARAGYVNAHFHLGTSKRIADDGINYIGLGFIDADHSFDWCLQDIRELSKLADRRTRILLHDFIDATNPGKDSNGVRAAAIQFLSENGGQWIGCPLDNYSGFFVLSMATDLRG